MRHMEHEAKQPICGEDCPLFKSSHFSLALEWLADKPIYPEENNPYLELDKEAALSCRFRRQRGVCEAIAKTNEATGITPQL